METDMLFSSFRAVFASPSAADEPELAGADPLPDIPILLSTQLQLELLLAEPVLDLRRISEVILHDLGATLQLFRVVGEEYALEEERPVRVEDCVASLNTEVWFGAVCAVTLDSNSEHLFAWEHAKRIGGYAERLAEEQETVRPGEGFLVGLLHEIGRLPELLGWGDTATLDGAPLGSLLAEHWHLPDCVVAAIREQEQVQARADKMWSVILAAAHTWADRDDQSGTNVEHAEPRMSQFSRGVEVPSTGLTLVRRAAISTENLSTEIVGMADRTLGFAVHPA